MLRSSWLGVMAALALPLDACMGRGMLSCVVRCVSSEFYVKYLRADVSCVCWE